MNQDPKLSDIEMNNMLREQIGEHIQQLAHLADPGSLVTSWSLVFSVTSADNPERGGFALESCLGQGLHVDLGLHEMAALLTRRRAIGS